MGREYYLRNRDKALARQKRFRMRNKAYWIRELGGKCVDCGHDDERVLTFDHKSNKQRTITSLITRANARDPDLVREMEKCELRCANCHLIKSVEQGEIGRKRKY